MSFTLLFPRCVNDEDPYANLVLPISAGDDLSMFKLEPLRTHQHPQIEIKQLND
jgi:hypothetical protein